MKKSVGIGLLLLACLTFAALGCGNDQELMSVVFDIDGTLTGFPLDYWGARPDAAEAVQAYVQRGYAVVYLTARPEALDPILQTNRFLKNNGFPDCPVYLADGLLSGNEIVTYKADTLDLLTSTENRNFQYGYGDSTTDFEAYNQAGIPVENTFALLRCLIPYQVCNAACEPGNYAECLTNGYQDQIPLIENLPVVNVGLDTMCTP